jgi:uncharacterized protein YbaP (TraB family)
VLSAQEDTALHWYIEDASGPRGQLLGTIHSEDPRVLDFTPEFLAQMQDHRIFAMELVPDLPTLSELQQRMNLPEGEDLRTIVGETVFNHLEVALIKHGLSKEAILNLQPWAAVMTLSVPAPETGLFMDFSLSLRASGSGLDVVGLESLGQQLAFLEELPRAQQLALIGHALSELGTVEKLHDQMVDVYLGGDLRQLHTLAMSELQDLDEPLRAAFVDRGVEARNQVMLNSALALLDSGRVFIAVGALHLPGPKGLLSLLREAGYVLRPAPWPLR